MLEDLRTAVTLLLVSFCCVLSGGCDSAQPTASLGEGVSNYEARRYSLARTQAQDVMERSSGPKRDAAAYLAGLAAYQLGDPNDARRQLLIAARSSDTATAGRASAQLGLLDLDEDQPVNAATHFRTAAEKLDGAESRQAAQHAAMAYQLAGDYDTAQQWMNFRSKGGPAVVAANRPRVYGGSRYVLQAGAFHERSRAERVARELRELAEQYRLGPVQVVPDRDTRGRSLHLVQFGGFATQAEAAQTRARIGRLEFIVVSASRPTS